MSESGDAGFDKQKELAAVNDLYQPLVQSLVKFS